MQIQPGAPLRGELAVPGDKSISHRALLLNTLVPDGVALLRGLSAGEDVAATAEACRQLGARLEPAGEGLLLRAPSALQAPSQTLDCGNSGTSIRLLLGALAQGQHRAVLDGDESLRRRPMRRLVGPLRAMGACISGPGDGERAPLVVEGRQLRFAEHDLPIASAQLKSALLLAGRACGVAVREPAQSRDHTERMLTAMGAALSRDGGWLSLSPAPLRALDVVVPGDLSAAAFLLVAAAIVPGSEIAVRGVGVNPTRTGVLDALRAMGADLRLENERMSGLEPIADLVVRHSPLRGTHIAGELALRSLDELVVLAVAAAFAQGVTTLRDAQELRVKESDRLARLAAGLRALGIAVDERPDGLTITGGQPRGPATVDATGDHRIAMAFAVAGLAAQGGVTLQGAASVTSSWPGFFGVLESLRRG